MKIVILAGGGGTRLWPISRKAKPKQVQTFIGTMTLLQKTYERQRRGYGTHDLFISTNDKSAAVIKRQIPGLPPRNLILEPSKRDTAPAIGLAAVQCAVRDPHAVMMTVGSDHYVKNEKEYVRLLRLAERTIQENPTFSLIIGIRPTYPETGYGYIKVNKLFKQVGNDEIFFGQKFIEKPNLRMARQYVKGWDYLWNTSMFCWRVDYLLGMYKRYLPAHYVHLMRIQKAIGTRDETRAIQREFRKMKPISVDYGIMERTKKILVIPASFEWADVGHWRAVKDILSKGTDENVIRGKHIAVDSRDNLIYSDTGRLISIVDIQHTIIIDTEDCVLVSSKERAHDVKKIVEKLKKGKLRKYL